MPARSPKRITFLSDLVTTVVESGSYLSWWRFKRYQCQIEPSHAELWADDPHKGDDGDHSMGPITLDIDLIAKGLGVIEKGVKGLHPSGAARILGASAINDAGMLDVNDADVIVQAAVFGEIVYG